jgi:hypothetical protein
MLKYVLITSLPTLLSLTFAIFCFARASRIVQFFRDHYASHRFLRSGVMFPFRIWWESDYAEAMTERIAKRLIGLEFAAEIRCSVTAGLNLRNSATPILLVSGEFKQQPSCFGKGRLFGRLAVNVRTPADDGTVLAVLYTF